MKLTDDWFTALSYSEAGQLVFVTVPTFGERLNECLAPFPTLPLQIHCEEDPDWDDYHEMLALEQDDEEDPISVE